MVKVKKKSDINSKCLPVLARNHITTRHTLFIPSISSIPINLLYTNLLKVKNYCSNRNKYINKVSIS